MWLKREEPMFIVWSVLGPGMGDVEPTSFGGMVQMVEGGLNGVL